MPTPDKDTIIRRLQNLHHEGQLFDKRDSHSYRSAEFRIWRSEVGSWIGKGSPHTDEQYSEFLTLRFIPFGYFSNSGWNQSHDERWHSDLKIAQHLIGRAIENLQQDWASPSEATEP